MKTPTQEHYSSSRVDEFWSWIECLTGPEEQFQYLTRICWYFVLLNDVLIIVSSPTLQSDQSVLAHFNFELISKMSFSMTFILSFTKKLAESGWEIWYVTLLKKLYNYQLILKLILILFHVSGNLGGLRGIGRLLTPIS